MKLADLPKPFIGLAILAEVCSVASYSTGDPTTAQLAMFFAFVGLILALLNKR